MRMKDGRWLEYAEYGNPEGKPIFFFHGTPGSRKMRPPYPEITARHNVRLITADRPGFGRSDFQPGRKLTDWPSDVIEIADALQIDRFAVIGFSGGGPHAAACAAKIHDRITCVSLVSSLAPELKPDVFALRVLFRSAEFAPWLLRPVLSPIRWYTNRRFQRVYGKAMSRLADCDREVAARPEIQSVFEESVLESIRPGLRGFVHELSMFQQPWGFTLGDLPSGVHIWHGKEDRFDGIDSFESIRGSIPHLLDHGHLLLFHYWDEILMTVCQTK